MFKKVKEKLKGVGRFMEEKIQAWSKFLSSDETKNTLGYVLVGLGLGFIASVRLKPRASV